MLLEFTLVNMEEEEGDRLKSILGKCHFIVRLTSFSLTRNASVTFFPLRASPPFLKSFLPILTVFSFDTGPAFCANGPILVPPSWSGGSSANGSSGSGVKVPSSLNNSGGGAAYHKNGNVEIRFDVLNYRINPNPFFWINVSGKRY